jgi:hypothetical protein
MRAARADPKYFSAGKVGPVGLRDNSPVVSIDGIIGYAVSEFDFLIS